MPNDFDRPRRRAPQQRRPGIFVEEPRSRSYRPRLTKWSILGRIAAMIFAFFILAFFLGVNFMSFVLAIPGGLVLYEVWYLTFEASFSQ